jgi:hypothetical protein
MSGFGNVDEITTDQLMFLSLASAEDARIRLGAGAVDRRTSGGEDTDDIIRKSKEHVQMMKDLKSICDDEYYKKRFEEQKAWRERVYAGVKRELKKEQMKH